MTKCKLELVEEKHLVKLKQWINNPNVHDFIQPRTPLTIDEIRKKYLSTPSEMKNIHYIILSGDKIPVGVVSLKNLHFVNRRAEFSIFIGEDEYRGKGYGKCATIEILKFAFVKLNLNKVFLEVYEFNKNAVELYKKIGFNIEGNLKSHSYKNGKYRNLLIMGIFRDDFLRNFNT
jgi:UDP-4-amino-4,6-dideoxy-N-acetyl-beta-L-altrosamine N-acetyltransferase